MNSWISVNVASRIEGLTKELQTAILISEATAAQLGPNFRLGRSAVLPVKGKTQPVQVVEVLGSESGIAPLRHISLGPEDSREPG
jgi:class 3 adenylate cyclase